MKSTREWGPLVGEGRTKSDKRQGMRKVTDTNLQHMDTRQ